MSRYLYTDHILEAFNVFHRPMELEEVAGYVAEMEGKSVTEVRLAVDNTLTAGWLHGFLSRDDNLYILACGYWDDEKRGTGQDGNRQKKRLAIRPKTYQPYPERRVASYGGIQEMKYGDHILSAFQVSRRPLTLTDIVNYVSSAANIRPAEVYDAVRVTLELALVHGFVQKQEEHIYFLPKELQEYFDLGI